MKKLNKKGFTLVELLAVIVLLGIVAVAAITSVTSLINSNKKKTFVSTYNEIRNQVSQRAVGDSSTVGSGDVTTSYGLNTSDYKLEIASNENTYTITLTGVSGGTYNNMTLSADDCKKVAGTHETTGGSCDGTAMKISGSVTQ